MRSIKWTMLICTAIAILLVTPFQLTAQVSGSGSSNRIPVWTGSTTLGNSVLFQSAGEVGIGTTTPAATLHVVGVNGGPNAPDALLAAGGSGATGSGGKGGPIELFGGAGGRGCICNLPGGAGGGVNMFGGNAGEGFVNGGVGGTIQILGGRGGQKNPSVDPATGGSGAAIQVGGGGGATFASGASRGGNGGSITLVPGVGGTGTPSPGSTGKVLLAPTGGTIGIGTSTPTATLTVVGGGTTLADHWTVRSSRAFKTDIQPLHDALRKIQQLQGVSYRSKADGKHEIGMVAEDVESIVPEIVSHDPETKEVQGLDYSRLTALLIEAVKTQQTQLRAQQAEIKRLKVTLGQLMRTRD